MNWKDKYDRYYLEKPRRLDFFDSKNKMLCSFFIHFAPQIKNSGNITNSFLISYTDLNIILNHMPNVQTVRYFDGYGTHAYKNATVLIMNYDSDAIEFNVTCELSDYKYKTEVKTYEDKTSIQPYKYIVVKFEDDKGQFPEYAKYYYYLVPSWTDFKLGSLIHLKELQRLEWARGSRTTYTKTFKEKPTYSNKKVRVEGKGCLEKEEEVQYFVQHHNLMSYITDWEDVGNSFDDWVLIDKYGITSSHNIYTDFISYSIAHEGLKSEFNKTYGTSSFNDIIHATNYYQRQLDVKTDKEIQEYTKEKCSIPLQEGVSISVHNHNTITIKEDTHMNFKKMFGNMNFGKVETSDIKYSIKGIAGRQNPSGNYFAYENGQLVDVTGMTFDMPIYTMPTPISNIVAGDVIMSNGSAYYVKDFTDDNNIVAINLNGEAEETIITKTNIFGMYFYSKVIDFTKSMGVTDATNPMASMIPFMMLSDGGEGNDMFKMMMMSQAFGGANGNNNMFDFSNPLMMMMLLKDDKSNEDDFFTMMALQGMTTQKKS